MALTYTPDPEIGKPCPDFTLPAVEGRSYSLAHFSEKKVLAVMFICNHCPYVKAIEDRLLNLAHEMKNQSVQFVAICSNDSKKYTEDSFEGLKSRWHEKNYPFPYLHDQDQSVAKAFGAVCTPDFFIYDENRKLKYRGRLDDSWKDETQVTQRELKNAIESILKNTPIEAPQIPSMGCSIKWLES